MDRQTTTKAQDALYRSVRRAAAATFRVFRRAAVPNDPVKMGEGPGTYEFNDVEMIDYCKTVIAALNATHGDIFFLNRDVDPTWTYGETIHQIWDNCRKQMTTAARLFRRLAAT